MAATLISPGSAAMLRAKAAKRRIGEGRMRLKSLAALLVGGVSLLAPLPASGAGAELTPTGR